MHLLLKSDWSIVLIMTGAVKQIVEEGRILVTVHHIFSTNNGMQNLISALKTSQPNGFTVFGPPRSFYAAPAMTDEVSCYEVNDVCLLRFQCRIAGSNHQESEG